MLWGFCVECMIMVGDGFLFYVLFCDCFNFMSILYKFDKVGVFYVGVLGSNIINS